MKNNIDEVKSIFSGERVYNAPEIYLSTVHSAKGLEYDTVYIIDLYKDEFPKSSSEEELEEERRLFYVAMTRARKKLYLLYPLKRNNKCLEASIFYDEVKQAIKVTKRHKRT